MTKHDTRRIARIIAIAHATLAPIAADGRRHDGRNLPGEHEAITKAIEHVREAARLVEALEGVKGYRVPSAQRNEQGDPATLQGACLSVRS